MRYFMYALYIYFLLLYGFKAEVQHLDHHSTIVVASFLLTRILLHELEINYAVFDKFM